VVNTTRRSWHGVAELLLAGPQHRRTGTIRLRVTPGGFATTTGEPDLRVDGAELVAGDHRFELDGASCAELATAVGVDAGEPVDLYREHSRVRVDDVLSVDAAAADHLARCLAVGDSALRRVLPDQVPVLWPEHFDLGASADEVNYGVSLGDAFHATPYAYVGPWRKREGSFWNAPFGAFRSARDLPGIDAISAFFVEGREQGH
jgi:hypothetical protein